jgi:ribonucleoside-diphosphate reductase alpha chain
MRKVAWDRGPVRLGTYAKADGSQVPLWHDSEVAAVAYAVQNIIESRSKNMSSGNHLNLQTESEFNHSAVMAGKKCTECGAHAVIRKDGCEFCTQCGHVGACG